MEETVHRSRKKIWLGLIALPPALILLGFGLTLITLPDVSGLKTGNPSSTALMRQRQAETRRQGRTLVIRQEWTPFAGIPRLLKESVRVTEDFSFYWHKAIDVEEIRQSLKQDIHEKRIARGGSTITQQLAKNLYLSTGKNLYRKFREYLIARRLEKTLSKDRIFEIYLNVIEFGPGVFGAAAGARHWFGKDIGGLDLEDIVRLTSIIPRPLTADPRGSSGWVRWRCGWILSKLKLHGIITESDFRSLSGKFE